MRPFQYKVQGQLGDWWQVAGYKVGDDLAVRKCSGGWQVDHIRSGARVCVPRGIGDFITRRDAIRYAKVLIGIDSVDLSLANPAPIVAAMNEAVDEIREQYKARSNDEN